VSPSSAPRGRAAPGPTLALFGARVVYALNWYNVGAILPLLRIHLGADAAALGIVLGAFLVGVGLFQVPAGILALRWGDRRTALAGLGLMGAACAASGAAPSWESLAAIRFAAGVGAALFFAPALSLVASYYPAGRKGPVIGLYNGGFSLGGTIGLVSGAAVGQTYGWPLALSLGGALLLVAATVCLALLPTTDSPRPRTTAGAGGPSIRAVLTSRSIWALSLALTGFWGAVYEVAQYFVDFGHVVHPAWTPGLAAAIAAAVVFVSFPSGPVGGWIGERVRDRRIVLAGFGAVTAGLALAIPFLPLDALVADVVALGAVDGIVFAVLYLLPTYLEETRDGGIALAVGVVNSIQVSIGSVLAVLFGWIVGAYGYTSAWLFAGIVGLALLPALAWVRDPAGSAEPASEP